VSKENTFYREGILGRAKVFPSFLRRISYKNGKMLSSFLKEIKYVFSVIHIFEKKLRTIFFIFAKKKMFFHLFIFEKN